MPQTIFQTVVECHEQQWENINPSRLTVTHLFARVLVLSITIQVLELYIVQYVIMYIDQNKETSFDSLLLFCSV